MLKKEAKVKDLKELQEIHSLKTVSMPNVSVARRKEKRNNIL